MDFSPCHPKGSFSKLLQTIFWHVAEKKLPVETTRVWLDVFCVNQHASNDQNKADVNAFATTIKSCEMGTIVVVDMDRCNPASRAW